MEKFNREKLLENILNLINNAGYETDEDKNKVTNLMKKYVPLLKVSNAKDLDTYINHMIKQKERPHGILFNVLHDIYGLMDKKNKKPGSQFFSPRTAGWAKRKL